MSLPPVSTAFNSKLLLTTEKIKIKIKKHSSKLPPVDLSQDYSINCARNGRKTKKEASLELREEEQGKVRKRRRGRDGGGAAAAVRRRTKRGGEEEHGASNSSGEL